MIEQFSQIGTLSELHPGVRDDERAVDFRFVNGVSGELKLLSGNPLQEGETYLLTEQGVTKRVEITRGSPAQQAANAEYLFRIV